MFTSRSEYRLLLRADNADQRITPLGLDIGCVSKQREKIFNNKLIRIKKGIDISKKIKASPNQLEKNGIKINHDGKKRTIMDLLAFSNINFKKLEIVWPELKEIDHEVKEQIQIEATYSTYLSRQREDIKDFKKDESLKIPNYKLQKGWKFV